MRRIFFLSALFIALSATATVRTVSNNPNNLAQYNTVQAAVDASSNGDTVYVHGSAQIYDGFTLTGKALVFIGPGFSPDKALPLTANIGGCLFIGALTSGSEVQGFLIQFSININGADNIRIVRNYIFNQDITFYPGHTYTGFLFEGNYIQSRFQQLGNGVNNSVIQNNVFYTGGEFSGFNSGVNFLVNHNLFYGPPSGFANCFTNCSSLLLTNNIFVRRNAGPGTSSCTFNNNITYIAGNNTPWASNGNIDAGGNVSNQSPELADETAVETGTFGLLLNFAIASGPANNGGSDGKDIGLLYDPVGFSNWSNSRFSRLPYMYSMNITNPVIASGGNINLVIEARRNN